MLIHQLELSWKLAASVPYGILVCLHHLAVYGLGTLSIQPAAEVALALRLVQIIFLLLVWNIREYHLFDLVVHLLVLVPSIPASPVIARNA